MQGKKDGGLPKGKKANDNEAEDEGKGAEVNAHCTIVCTVVMHHSVLIPYCVIV